MRVGGRSNKSENSSVFARKWLAVGFGLLYLWAGAPLLEAGTTAKPDPKPARFEGGRLERVKALRDPMLQGSIPTYYTPGYEQRARGLQTFFSEELQFAKQHMSFHLTVSLAVLDSAQYALSEHEAPYPTPSCTGDPPVAMMPVNWTGGLDVLPKEHDAAAAVRQAVITHHLRWSDARQSAYDLWGGHELGHAILEAYGINPGTRWLNEFIASYVLYSYLASEQPGQLWLIDVLEVGGQPNQLHRFVSLDDLDSHYLQIAVNDPRNYLWFQAQFFEQIKQIYARRGVEFLRALRGAFPDGHYEFATLGTAETLRRLDTIDPGFSAWARHLESMPRANSPSVP
jgi:hypothetical protein